MILRLPPHGHPACFALSVFAHPQADLKIIIRPLQTALSCNLALNEHDGINYLRFLTRSVAGLQHYAQMNQTVSEDCDVLVIRDSGAQWITSPDILR